MQPALCLPHRYRITEFYFALLSLFLFFTGRDSVDPCNPDKTSVLTAIAGYGRHQPATKTQYCESPPDSLSLPACARNADIRRQGISGMKRVNPLSSILSVEINVSKAGDDGLPHGDRRRSSMTASAYLTQTSRLFREDRVLEVPKAETAADRWIPAVATPSRPAAVRRQIPEARSRPNAPANSRSGRIAKPPAGLHPPEGKWASHAVQERPERDEFRRRHGHGGRLMSQRSGDPDSTCGSASRFYRGPDSIGIGAIFRKKTHH